MFDITKEFEAVDLPQRFNLIEERLNEILEEISENKISNNNALCAMNSTEYHYRDFFDRETKYVLVLFEIYRNL